MTALPNPLPWSGREPRRWQAEALPLALEAIRSGSRAVVSAIMGSGKALLAAEVCAMHAGRVLVTVPTVALVEQLAATISARCPGDVGRYYTDAKQAGERITIACLPSVPTLIADPAWPGPPSLWIADEAHRSEAATIRDSYAAMQPASALGFTATPFRADETEELSLWDREIYTYGVSAALRDRVIVTFRAAQWTGEADTDLDTACRAMVKRYAKGPGLANARSIEDAEEFAGYLTASGVPSVAVHSRVARAEIGARMEALRRGDLGCVVHVNMLSEGVDYPWLRWLLLRRPVRSRVRFCQEVGRVLRADPANGKTEAMLLDPHDLLRSFALSYEAILSGMAAAKDDAPLERELRDASAWLDRFDEPRLQPRAIDAARRYLRQLYLAALSVGAIEQRVKSTEWRKLPRTPKQLEYAERLVGGVGRDTGLPLEHRKVLTAIGERIDRFTRGDVSDFLSLGFLFRDARGRGGVGSATVWARMFSEGSA